MRRSSRLWHSQRCGPSKPGLQERISGWDSSGLTERGRGRIMKAPGNRDLRVTIKVLRQDWYDRIRSQGRRRFRTFQSLGSEYCRDAREGNRQPGGLYQRRSGSGSAESFVEGTADGGYEVGGVCGLSGIAADKDLLSSLLFLQRPSLSNALPCFFLFLATLWLSGCGGHKRTEVQVPPPPQLPTSGTGSAPATARSESSTATDKDKDKENQNEKIEVPAGAKPVFEETGMASWYGAPYHNRRGSNGEFYNMHAMTAAHLTLPLGSIVRVTNVKTGHTAVVRITDRGPFVEGRILDLSFAAAKALDVYMPGVAKVRLEVLKVPSPLETGGRWAVQIGSFAVEKNASEVADHLQRRSRTAKVLRFASPVGDWWVRVRVLDDNRERAQTLARETQTPEGSVFLVRLD